MTINTTTNADELVVAVEGRIDTNTAPELEAKLQGCLDGVTKLVFDLGELVYISSAGLRVLLSAQKIMNKQGEMVIRNANDDIKEIFDVTGFVDILTIE